MQPFRLAVQKALTARLEEIAGVIETADVTMAGKVFRGRATFGQDDPLPMISILEEAQGSTTDDGDSADQSDSVGDYRLVLQGFIEDAKENPTDNAHYLMAWTKSKLAEVKSERYDAGLLGQGKEFPCVDDMDWDGGVVRPPDGEVSPTAFFWLRLRLSLVEDHLNPMVP